jgi:hypothetical protein
VKHLKYTEKSNICLENYESDSNSSCNITCRSKSIHDGICNTRTTSNGLGGFGGCGFGVSGCGFGFGYGCGLGCEVGFFSDGFHKLIIQTISQINTCRGNGDDQKAYSNDNQDQSQKDKQTVCLNTAINTAGHGFVTIGKGSLSPTEPTTGHKQPSIDVDRGGNGGSGGAGGAGGEGGQGGTNVGDNTSKNNSTVNQNVNGGGASGGHGGNANGGDARTLIFTLH